MTYGAPKLTIFGLAALFASVAAIIMALSVSAPIRIAYGRFGERFSFNVFGGVTPSWGRGRTVSF